MNIRKLIELVVLDLAVLVTAFALESWALLAVYILGGTIGRLAAATARWANRPRLVPTPTITDADFTEIDEIIAKWKAARHAKETRTL